MALQKNITLSSGINLPESYIKITSIVFNCNNYAEISVSIYKDKASNTDGKQPAVELKHKCSDFLTYFDINILNQEGVNMTSKAYEYLKTLPFYSNATDVIEDR